MAKKSEMQTVRVGSVFAQKKKVKLEYALKKNNEKFILEITPCSEKLATVETEQMRSVKSSVTEYRPKLTKAKDKLSAAELKKYEADTKKINNAINNGLGKVVDGKFNEQEVEPFVVEKNIQQMVKVETERITWVKGTPVKFDLYIDLNVRALRAFVVNYSKTL
jgi:hypothetical protein